MGQRILFLNDLGFQYGAGIASARQIASLLLGGHTVAALAWEPGHIPEAVVLTRPGLEERWLGIHRVSHLNSIHGVSDDAIIEGVLCAAARFRPDTIIIGNLHSPNWPLRLISAMRRLGAEVVAYVHDCYLFTGRCAYPGDCNLYLTGCDASCPTSTEYPPLEPAFIRPAWKLRRELFTGPNATKVITNSHWSAATFKTAMPEVNFCETVYLGTDETVFTPSDRHSARVALNLPADKPLIVSAAVNFDDRRKGGHLLEKLIKLLGTEVYFAGFGHNPELVKGMIPIPYRSNPEDIARLYQAADVFVATSLEESFGQTILEAQLCGCPVVAFNVGGIPEIVHNEITGFLVPKGNVEEMAEAIRTLVRTPDVLNTMSGCARSCAEIRFSLQAQADGWNRFLSGKHLESAGASTPDLIHAGKEAEDGDYRPSWSGVKDFVNDQHKAIFDETSALPGWQMPGDTLKLYELGYFAGDVILEIGTYGGRSATVELRGALANPKRTQSPKFYGVDIDPGSIARTRQTLVDEKLDHYCHLYLGVLEGFLKRWKIIPTMVFVDGDHRYEGIAADIRLLAQMLPGGTPVLFHDFLNPENQEGSYGVRKAVEEWIQSGDVRLAGFSGCSALVVVN
jgi:glycosyltransferase involved in cell wall biosynthesis